MSPFTATFSRPDRWIEAAFSSEVTPVPASAGERPSRAAQIVVRHCTENRGLYEDPCTNEEAAQLLRRLGLAVDLTAVSAIPTSLLVDALREATEWIELDEHELSSSAARDALLAVDTFSGVSSGIEALDVSLRLLEALCARVLGHRAGEALLSPDSSLSMKAALLLDLVAAGAAAHVDRPHGVIQHLLAARLYRSRYSMLKGFLRPYRRLSTTLASASTIRAASLVGAESIESIRADVGAATLSDRLTATAQLYLSEALPSTTLDSVASAEG